jgi:hypothetical protein
MGASQVLAELTRRGVELVVDGDRLRFRPQSAVTPDLRDALIEHKADLIRLLGPDDDVAWRVEAMRPQVPRTGAIPILLARPEAKSAPLGMCVSCGDPLTEGRRIRCAHCVRAVERVLNETREGR